VIGIATSGEAMPIISATEGSADQVATLTAIVDRGGRTSRWSGGAALEDGARACLSRRLGNRIVDEAGDDETGRNRSRSTCLIAPRREEPEDEDEGREEGGTTGASVVWVQRRRNVGTRAARARGIPARGS